MSCNTKVLLATAALMVGGLGLAPAALADQGGAAGAASFQLDGAGNVLNSSVAGAIGKVSAYAGTTNDTFLGTLEAFAVGTGGNLNIDGVYVDAVGFDPDLGTAQANELEDEIEIDLVGPEFDIEL